MINIYSGRTERQSFKNVSIKGLSLPIYIKHASTNTAFASGMWDPTLATIQINLLRNGVKTPIANDTLSNLIALTGYSKPVFEYLKDTSKNIQTVAAAVGVKAEGYMPLIMDFGSVINLKGSDELIVDITINSGFFSATLADTTGTVNYMQLDYIPGVGLEYFTPVFRQEVIQTNQTNPSFDLGDNVTRIVLYNVDKTDTLTASQVATQVNISSNKLSSNDTVQELYTKKRDLFVNDADAAIRKQSYMLHDGSDLDNVRIDLTLTGANVNASKNFVLYRSFFTSIGQIKSAKQRAAKHEQEDLYKIAQGTK